MVLSGSVEDFSAIAAIIDAYAFREDGGSSTAVGEAKSVEAFPVRDDSPQPGGNGGERREVAKAVLVGVGGDMRRRRLAALDNCLDAFDRSVPCLHTLYVCEYGVRVCVCVGGRGRGGGERSRSLYVNRRSKLYRR